MSDPRRQSPTPSKSPLIRRSLFLPPRKPRPYWLHVLLLLLTIGTTLIVGARLQYNFTHDLPAFEPGRLFVALFPINVDLAKACAPAVGHSVLCDSDGHSAGARVRPLSCWLRRTASMRRCRISFPRPHSSERSARSFASSRRSAREKRCSISALPGRSLASWSRCRCCSGDWRFPSRCRPNVPSSALEFGYPLIFQLCPSRAGAVHATSDVPAQPVSASGRRRGLGGNVRHRTEPPARRTI